MPDRPTPHSAEFWDAHYAAGGTSGTGSYGRLAQFKADVLNAFLDENAIGSVIELGCGDGNQLSLIRYPRYLGLDTSPAAVALCRERFAADAMKRFLAYRPGDPMPEQAELAVSLDVVYHLLEDETYEQYMHDLFDVATRFVIVYSSDMDEPSEWPEVRHRAFTDWVRDHAARWTLRRRIPNRYPYVPGDVNSAWADFFIYEKTPGR